MTTQLEYIASGCSYLRLQAKRNAEGEAKEIFERAFKYVNGANKHKFGLLYNAFTESSFGERFQEFKDHVSSIHADSGGLQIITQGKSITESLKDDVYRNQARFSDLGMCFDEIPIGMSGERSGRNDVNNRWFKKEEMEFYARQTGKNIRRQVELFLEEKSTSKPILIAQGNCLDTYKQWVEFIVDELPQEYLQYIGGIAMGAAAFGTGPLEDISRAFYYTQLPIDLTHNHLHILGVGSAKRLLPYLLMVTNGMYEGSTVSYDSTTHTSGVELGLFYTKDWKQIKFNRQYGQNYINFFEETLDVFPELSEFGPKDFHEVMNTGWTKYTENLGKDDLVFTKMRTGFSFKSIFNFTNHVGSLVGDIDLILTEADKIDLYQPMKALNLVKTEDDFRCWESTFNRYIKSNRVASGQPSTLESFFD